MYQIMFYVGLACTFIFLVASVVLFVKNDVKKRIGDLTGTNARKAIKKLNEGANNSQKMTEATEDNKTDVHSKIKVIDKTTKKSVEKKAALSDKRVKEESTDSLVPDDEATDVLPTIDEATEMLYQDELTDVLTEDEATDVLTEDEATELLTEDEATDVLTDDEATDILTEDITEPLTMEEATELLYEEIKISEGSFDSILNGATNPEEDSSIPDIFEVEEDVTVVHTQEKI